MNTQISVWDQECTWIFNYTESDHFKKEKKKDSLSRKGELKSILSESVCIGMEGPANLR